MPFTLDQVKFLAQYLDVVIPDKVLDKKAFDEFQKEKARLIDDIRAVEKESAEIGGEDLRNWIGKTDKLETDRKWVEALDMLHETHRRAEVLAKRKPYVEARHEYLAKINAAKKIGGEHAAVGKYVTESWDKIEKLAKDGQFDEAADAIRSLGHLIEKQFDPALSEDREKNQGELADLKKQMKKEMKNGSPDDMRKVALKIFANNAQAEKLGVDTGIKARMAFEDTDPVWTADLCEKTFGAYDWFALKKCRKAGELTVQKKKYKFSDDNMWKLVQYRGKVVNELIDSLRKKYPTLIAKASGSEDIESDIDITFATPGSGDDVEAAMEFNAAIKARFGKPPGRVFDVNIYPRDYGAIRESFKPDYNVEPIKDVNIDEPENESMKLSKIDQDVATLLKQRRFLDASQFNKMLKAILESAPDEATKKRIEKQYEEGEDIYLLTALEKVEKLKAAVKLGEPSKKEDERVTELRKKLAQLEKLKGGNNAAAAQKLIPEVLELFEEAYPSETMDVTDALYLEKMRALRGDQADIRTLKHEDDIQAHHPGKTCQEAHPKDHDHDQWRIAQLNALEVKVKKDMFTNIVFANEAIMSQGAIRHVVHVLQEKDIEIKKTKVKDLTAADLMQSVNENVSDLFKESKHYEAVAEESVEQASGKKGKATAERRANGEGYVHASKYLARLLDAATALNLKYPDEPSVTAKYKQVGNQDLEALKKKVEDVLLNVRKSVNIPPEAKGEIGYLEIKELFPKVNDLGDFRQLIEDFAVELNRRIRSLKDFKESQEMETAKERKAETKYFEVAAPKTA
jgi:hypothetical protein